MSSMIDKLPSQRFKFRFLEQNQVRITRVAEPITLQSIGSAIELLAVVSSGSAVQLYYVMDGDEIMIGSETELQDYLEDSESTSMLQLIVRFPSLIATEAALSTVIALPNETTTNTPSLSISKEIITEDNFVWRNDLPTLQSELEAAQSWVYYSPESLLDIIREPNKVLYMDSHNSHLSLTQEDLSFLCAMVCNVPPTAMLAQSKAPRLAHILKQLYSWPSSTNHLFGLVLSQLTLSEAWSSALGSFPIHCQENCFLATIHLLQSKYDSPRTPARIPQIEYLTIALINSLRHTSTPQRYTFDYVAECLQYLQRWASESEYIPASPVLLKLLRIVSAWYPIFVSINLSHPTALNLLANHIRKFWDCLSQLPSSTLPTDLSKSLENRFKAGLDLTPRPSPLSPHPFVSSSHSLPKMTNVRIVQGTQNQYSKGGSASCTQAVLTAAIMLLSGHPISESLVDQILDQVKNHQGNKHPEIQELINTQEFRNRLAILQDIDSSSAFVTKMILKLQAGHRKANAKEPIAFVLIGMGITVLFIQQKQNYIIFNSHPSPMHANAAFLSFNGPPALTHYFKDQLFPILDMDGPRSIGEDLAGQTRILMLRLHHAESVLQSSAPIQNRLLRSPSGDFDASSSSSSFSASPRSKYDTSGASSPKKMPTPSKKSDRIIAQKKSKDNDQTVGNQTWIRERQAEKKRRIAQSKKETLRRRAPELEVEKQKASTPPKSPSILKTPPNQDEYPDLNSEELSQLMIQKLLLEEQQNEESFQFARQIQEDENDQVAARRKASEHLATQIERENREKARIMNELQQKERDEKESLRLVRELQEQDLHCLEDSNIASAAQEKLFLCRICSLSDDLDEYQSTDDVFEVPECGHRCCRECASGHMQAQLESGSLPIRCFQTDCESTIDQTSIQLILSPERFALFLNLSLRPAITGANYWTCPQPDCPNTVEIDEFVTKIECVCCQFTMCLRCESVWHDNMTCEQYQQWLTENGQADQRFQEYMKAAGTKNCPQCQIPLELTHGCHRMKCICKTHFCWLCLEILDSQNPYQHYNQAGTRCVLFPNYDHIQ